MTRVITTRAYTCRTRRHDEDPAHHNGRGERTVSTMAKIRKAIWTGSIDETDDERARREHLAARERWIARNKAVREAGCPCGGPAETVIYEPETIGGVPAEFWQCLEHEGATQWSVRGEVSTPLWRHFTECPLGETKSRGWKNGRRPTDGPADHFHCPHRTHEDTE